ncbi:hypothetical protein IMZ48_24320 [Candidatus Bathyarchaeota archaeon]|nr:hypothetical protein [Candidatus Bathyarchaeota archaeon]
MSKEARVSGETPRSGEPILPVANPGGDGEFAAKPKPQIPAALYVV